ncbi:flagellar protein FlgN [Robertmurraya korlensis]|uniref:flagellar protein FlgN n=1 Tax=Robertmurraya korlensis TaxID=519977 RepID=UPI000825561D|nr:flagellar protein FlgN [Robertmurraya korlensis]
MSAEQLVTVMERLLDLHKELLDKAFQKTTIIEKGDIDALNTLIKDEQKLVININKFEQVRQQFVRNFLTPFHVEGENFTISTCLTYIDDLNKDKLADLRDELLEVAQKLQKQNELNSDLVKQSLQFVQMSLDMFYPKTPEFNYGPPKQTGTSTSNSLFNRKA